MERKLGDKMFFNGFIQKMQNETCCAKEGSVQSGDY
jgi:hypothetical protein